MSNRQKDASFAALLDFSFNEFVTMSVIKILYIIAIALSALGILFFVITSFMASVVTGLIMLILSPIFFVLYVLFARIWLEIIMVIFRIEENTKVLAEYTMSD